MGPENENVSPVVTILKYFSTLLRMQVLSRNPQKGLDCSFLLKMEAELLADVVDDCQHTIPWRNHTRTIRCWHRKSIRRAHKATPEEEFKSRPRTHETRSTFFLFRELRIQKLSSRRKIEDCETKAEQLCLWRSFEAFTDFKLPFFFTVWFKSKQP